MDVKVDADGSGVHCGGDGEVRLLVFRGVGAGSHCGRRPL